MEIDTIELSSTTRVSLYPLAIRQEEGDYIVGRTETSTFVSLPQIGGTLVMLLQRNLSLGNIQRQLEQEYGAGVELNAFINDLLELGFVRAIDGQDIEIDAAKPPNLAWLQTKHVRWIFSWPVRMLYLTLLVFAAIAFLHKPQLFPHYTDFFWAETTSILIFTATLIFVVNTAMHELAHMVAARSRGVPARIGLGTRLMHLAVETDVTGVWTLPSNERYRVYLAGMLWDLIPISVSVILLAFTTPPDIIQSLLKLVVIVNFLGILGQFEFYMRTDVYFMMLTWLRCYDLFEDSLRLLRYYLSVLWFALFGRSRLAYLRDPLVELPKHERSKVQLYAVFMTIGSIIALFLFFFYGLPIMLRLFVEAGIAVWRGFLQQNPWMILDGSVTITIEGGLLILFILTFVRNRKQWYISSVWGRFSRWRRRITPPSAYK